MTSPRVIVIGDVVEDLLVSMNETLAYGADTRAHINTCPGGAGANQAAWLPGLGVETHFVCRVGDDPFGEHLVEELERGGVIAHVTKDPSLPTGKIIIMVDQAGERTMVTDRGANLGLDPGDIPADLLGHGSHLHLSGYSFFEAGPRRTALQALKQARQAGMTVSVDPASASLLEDVGPENFLMWTSGSNLCFPNLDEGMVLTGAREPKPIVKALSEYYAGVLLKLGAEGSMYAKDGQEPLCLAADTTQAIDTTGAGDAFCAGFLASWLTNCSPEEAMCKASLLASQTTEFVGARSQSRAIFPQEEQQ